MIRLKQSSPDEAQRWTSTFDPGSFITRQPRVEEGAWRWEREKVLIHGGETLTSEPVQDEMKNFSWKLTMANVYGALFTGTSTSSLMMGVRRGNVPRGGSVPRVVAVAGGDFINPNKGVGDLDHSLNGWGIK
jgi:hypothetical protein